MSLIARLIEAGTPADLIAEVARELARAEVAQEAIEQRRAKDRERQQRRRDNVMSRDAADVTTAPSLSRPPNEINSNPPTHTHPEGVNAPAREAEPLDAHVEAWREWREKNPFPRPWWADKRVWADWMQVRKRKGGVNTITAHSGFLADIARHADAEWPPGRLLSLAVSKSWLSINRPHGSPRNERPAPRNDEIQNPYARAALARQADRAAAVGG